MIQKVVNTVEKIRILCDYREMFPSKCEEALWNDHLPKASFDALAAAIRSKGHDCDIFGGVPNLIHAYEQKLSFPDTLFLNASDGMDQPYSRTQIPVLCDMLKAAYIGCGTFAATLAANKHYTKLAMQEAGIDCPRRLLLTTSTKEEGLRAFIDSDFPVLFKRNTEGSSLGITQESVCRSKDELVNHIEELLNQFEEIEVEQYIAGFDATDFVIGNPGHFLLNEVLVTQHHGKFFFEKEVLGYTEYLKNDVTYANAAGYMDQSTIQKIQEISQRAFCTLGAQDYIRIDYRVTAENRVFLLEINTVPALKMESQVGTICAIKNWSLGDFCDRLIQAAHGQLMCV